MGDGRVALIVDIVSLAQKASIASNPVTRHADAKESDAADVRQRESWLIFRAGQRNRLALPLSTVNRLEEVQPSLIEYSSGREVVQYRDEIMPLLRLADALQVPQSPCKDKPLQVVVQSSPAGILGLVVDEILEIVDQPASITRAPEHSLLVGSAVIQQHVTDLLNIPALLSSEMTTGRTV